MLRWRTSIVWAILSSACLLTVVLPLAITPGWTLLVQLTLLAGLIVFHFAYLHHGDSPRSKRRWRGPGWRVQLPCMLGLAAALGLALLARHVGLLWLGVAAVLVNTAALAVLFHEDAKVGARHLTEGRAAG